MVWRVAAALTSGVLAVAASAAGARADVFRKRPYLQSVGRDAVTIMWEPRRPGPGRILLEGDAPRVIDVEPDAIVEAHIDGLAPGRRYRYTVEVDGERVSGELATAPEAGAPFTFVVYGDSRSNPGSHRAVVERVRREVPDFLLGTGDMVNEGSSEADWQTFFDIEADLLRENALFPSLGNHDRQGRGRTADNFREYFALPENSPNPERYYAFTYGSARFLVLDSNAYSFALTDQTAWIEEQLQAARLDPAIRHVFVSMHHPPFSTALHGGNAELRDAWAPLFERYRVDAVFSGHDHDYERSERAGVHYFVSGGGGAPLYPHSHHPSRVDQAASQYFERVNHYLRVHVVGGFVEVTAIRVDGSVIETTSWGTPPAMNASAVGGPAPAPVAGLHATGAGAPATAASGATRASTVRAAAPMPLPALRGRAGLGPLGYLAIALGLAAGIVLLKTLLGR